MNFPLSSKLGVAFTRRCRFSPSGRMIITSYTLDLPKFRRLVCSYTNCCISSSRNSLSECPASAPGSTPKMRSAAGFANMNVSSVSTTMTPSPIPVTSRLNFSSLSRSVCSASLRSVMLRDTARMPVGAPASSLINDALTSAQIRAPSMLFTWTSTVMLRFKSSSISFSRLISSAITSRTFFVDSGVSMLSKSDLPTTSSGLSPSQRSIEGLA